MSAGESKMQTYEEQLNQNRQWAFQEGSMHFENESAVHKALNRIVHRLEELGIPYVIVGGMALFFHGLRRFTEDVDILVTRDGLKRLHAALDGLGYVPPFAGSNNLRDVESGVKIEFLVTGNFPGDGKPKPVAFPDPEQVATVIEGIRFLELPKLIELKLASGMTNPLRGQDIVDVQRLIQVLELPESLRETLNPYVQSRYSELWQLIHNSADDAE
jgi:hypothetical protein